jgi:ornithine carbamoyltransferase
MKERFTGRDFLTLIDFRGHDIIEILDLSDEFKLKSAMGESHEYLRGKTVAMLFEKPSTRTRISFQAAISHLGAQSFFMNPSEMQLSRGESIKDTARVIDRYCDILVMRTFGQERLEEFARFMNKPVINALSNQSHPCQCLADFMTIREKKKSLKGLKLMYTGDVSNVAHSLMVAGSMIGMDIFITVPTGYNPEPKYWDFAREQAVVSNAKIVLTSSFDKAIEGADIVYANTWHPMHLDPSYRGVREKDFMDYQINETSMKKANPDAIFMHCLPAFRGKEITDEVIEGSQSVVWDQAENKMHTGKALLSLLIG